MTLTVGSLFAGIGGIELGLERAGGFEAVWQVEKDDYCRQVLAKHWPDVTRYEDVTDVGADELEPVDLICGGFPCQDISLAGRGGGIDGERGLSPGERSSCRPGPLLGGSGTGVQGGPRKTEWAPEPDVDRVVDGVPDQMDRLRSLGNAVVPQVAEWIGRRIVEHAEVSR